MRDTHRKNKSIPLLSRQFINDLMAGYYGKARIEEAVQELGLKIYKENLIALDLLIVDYYDKTRDLWGELLKYAVYNCVQELGQSVDICAVEVFQGNADHVYIILSSQDGDVTWKNRGQDLQGGYGDHPGGAGGGDSAGNRKPVFWPGTDGGFHTGGVYSLKIQTFIRAGRLLCVS